MKSTRKYHLCLPHPFYKWKGGGTVTKTFLHGLFLCSSSAIFLLPIRKPAIPACVKETWRQHAWCGVKTEWWKQHEIRPEGTSGHPAMPTAPTISTITTTAQQRQLSDSTQGQLLTKPVCPIFQQQGDRARKWPPEQRNFWSCREPFPQGQLLQSAMQRTLS